MGLPNDNGSERSRSTQTSLWIDKTLLREAKMAALVHGSTVARLIHEGLRLRLDQLKALTPMGAAS